MEYEIFLTKCNLSFINFTNKCFYVGKYDMPNVSCSCENIKIDYLVLYSHLSEYDEKSNKAVCFYQYDQIFDGINGLFNAIYYNDKKLLEKYKKRFENVKILIAPDYSVYGDLPLIENLYRIFKSRVVSAYLINEWDKIVIPNITFVDDETKETCFSGIDKNTVVAISALGCLKEKEQKKLFSEIIDETIKRISPSIVVIYNISTKSNFLNEQIKKLENNGIMVLIPDNKFYLRSLERNRMEKTH